MKKNLLLLSLLVLFGLFIGGCSNSTDPVDANATIDEFGAYTPTNEAPSFDDSDVAELTTEAEETIVSDPIANSPIIDSVENQDIPDIFCMRIVWGNLERDSGVTDLTDWSGTLTLTRGAIVVKRTIRFEPGQDYLLPRYNDSGIYVPEELGWVSKTSWAKDGLRINVYIPPSETSTEPVTLTYESEQLTMTFSMDDLEEMDTLVNIGYGNAISFQSMRFDPSERTHGALAGRWGRDDDGNGIFYGVWMAANGSMMGTLKGDWGVDDSGKQVFAGKYIDENGQFEGLIKGVWRIHGVGANATGHFTGRIYNSNYEPIGVLRGHFKRGNTRKGGYFAGRWCVGCTNSMQDERF